MFSTSDGGLTWTNYFQPPNWKNSRITAVPGTNAFVSTSTHPNPLFTGSSVSYDAGQTWTDIERNRPKAACRFFDANTGYAGSFYVTSHPIFGVGGLYKSEIVFQDLSSQAITINKPVLEEQLNRRNDQLKVYPSPATDVLNIALPEGLATDARVISIVSADGKIVDTRRSKGAQLVQVDVSNLTPGIYIVRIQTNKETISKSISIGR